MSHWFMVNIYKTVSMGISVMRTIRICKYFRKSSHLRFSVKYKSARKFRKKHMKPNDLKPQFKWDDAFLLDDQLSDEER